MKTKKWKPTCDETYYRIYIGCFGSGIVQEDVWWNTTVDNNRLKEGNCFRCKKEAQAKLREIKKVLKERE